MLLTLIILALVGTTMGGQHRFSSWGLSPYAHTSLGDNVDLSTMKILKAAYNSARDKNIVSSPLSLMILLSLYNLGVDTAIGAEINNFLGGTDVREISSSFKQLNSMFSDMDPAILSVANKISVSDQCNLNETFAAEAREYRSEFDKIDFTKPEEAAAKINQWASEKTNGLITEPVNKDALTPDMILGLFNVIYFNGHWHVPFKAEDTVEKDFHVADDCVVKRPMMHLQRSLFYLDSAELGAKLVELPYKEKGFRMIVVLPNETYGLPSVLDKVVEKGLLTYVFKLKPTRLVELEMPKFEVRAQIDFNDILPKVGVSKIFNEPATGIVRNIPVRVSKAFQEAFIKVNEEGATAGAFTGMFAVPLSSRYVPPTPVKFIVDHPFLYMILYEDKILFAGTYTH